jgi:hypothetical protein
MSDSIFIDATMRIIKCVHCDQAKPVGNRAALAAARLSEDVCAECLHTTVHAVGFTFPSDKFTACGACDYPAFKPTNARDIRTGGVLCEECVTDRGVCIYCNQRRDQVCVHFCVHCTQPVCCECEPRLHKITDSTCKSCMEHAARDATADAEYAKAEYKRLKRKAERLSDDVKRLKTH